MNVRFSGSFSGVYGTGKALATALSTRRLTSSSMEYSFDFSEFPSPTSEYQEDKGFILGGQRVSFDERHPYQLLTIPSYLTSTSTSRSKLGVTVESDEEVSERGSGSDEEDVEGKEINTNIYNYQDHQFSQSQRRLANITNPNTVFNPVVCLVVGASIIFDVSNVRYPVYLKDSLLNTNPGFDYSSFRQLAALASTTVTISSFAFTFSSAGKKFFFLLIVLLFVRRSVYYSNLIYLPVSQFFCPL